MLTIKQIRDNIPDKGKDLSDEEVIKLRDTMYGLANIFFDMWLKKRNAKKEVKK